MLRRFFLGKKRRSEEATFRRRSTTSLLWTIGLCPAKLLGQSIYFDALPNQFIRDGSQNVPASLLVAVSFALTVCLTFAQNVQAQISDTLDSYPPRWSLVSSDCQAEMQTHSNLTAGGIQNSGCESISLRCRNGTQALLEYRIEPVHVIDELTATVHLRSNKSGQRVGLRVRFPYQLRSDGRESVSTIVYGTDYRDATHWQKLGIGAISSQLRLKTIALRSEYGPQANLKRRLCRCHYH